jgi:hypothetical protein
VPRFTYTGDEPQTYPQYLDAEKGTALVAKPGETYDIVQVEGLTTPAEDEIGDPVIENGAQVQAPVELAMPPDGRWVEARSESKRAKSKYAEGGEVRGPVNSEEN